MGDMTTTTTIFTPEETAEIRRKNQQQALDQIIRPRLLDFLRRAYPEHAILDIKALLPMCDTEFSLAVLYETGEEDHPRRWMLVRGENLMHLWATVIGGEGAP